MLKRLLLLFTLIGTATLAMPSWISSTHSAYPRVWISCSSASNSFFKTLVFFVYCFFGPSRIFCLREVAEKAKIPNFFPALVKPKAEKIGPIIQSTFAKAYKAGVKIAFGTDSGVSKHGDNWQEFILMTNAGMSNLDALKSATIETAKLLRVEDKLGQIKPGMLADIIAVKKNPLEDISTVKNVSFVMKDGVIYKQSS